jgi:hypothetical protein
MIKLWDYLKDNTRTFPEVEETVTGLKDDELENALMAIFCAGLIDIKNLGLARHRWRITALGDAK